MADTEQGLFFQDLARLSQALSSNPNLDPALTLQRLCLSDDTKSLEFFPVILSSCLTRTELADRFSMRAIAAGLSSTAERKRFRLLVAITHHLLKHLPGSSEQAQLRLVKYLNEFDAYLIDRVAEAFAAGTDIELGANKLGPERLRQTFLNNLVKAPEPKPKKLLTEELEAKREQTLRESLKEIFSARQAEIIERVLSGDSLTKTESEYYCRVIKIKLRALANKDLHSLATQLSTAARKTGARKTKLLSMDSL